MRVDLLGLPCQRGRHDACTGAFTLGVGLHRRSHDCLCRCHWIRQQLGYTLALEST